MATQNQLNYFEHQQAAGLNAFPDRTTERFIAHNDPEVRTRSVTVASGQVLKARSWVESNAFGKMVAHGTIAEQASVAFAGTLKNGDVAAFAGLSYTASADSTSAEVVAGLVAGAGTYTKGVVTVSSSTIKAKWSLEAGSTSVIILAKGIEYGTNPTDVAVAVTNTSTTSTLAGTVTTSPSGTTTFNTPVGFLAFDVDATSADTLATIYAAGSFWEDALVWAVDTAVDTVTIADGTTVACTAYNTGAITSLARQKFVEGLQIELVPIKTGEFM